MLIGGGDHDDVGPLGRLLVGHHPKARGFRLLRGRRAGTQRDRDLAHAAVAQILRMGVTLAAIADDGDLLALDEVLVGVAIVVNLHSLNPFIYSFIRHPRESGDPELASADRKSTRLNSSH